MSHNAKEADAVSKQFYIIMSLQSENDENHFVFLRL